MPNKKGTVALSEESGGKELIAPLGHTAIMLLIIAVLTVVGFYSQTRISVAASTEPPASHAPLYLSVLALQLGLLRFIVVGLRRKGMTLAGILGDGRGRTNWAVDFLIGGVFWLVAAGILELIKMILGGVDANVSGLLPQGPLEVTLWIALSITAGFVEEVCYRGYLQKQALSLTGSATAAILLQALLFGISHSYQGLKSTVVILAYGILFGLLAHWRRNLRPGIIAHALTDILGGIAKF